MVLKTRLALDHMSIVKTGYAKREAQVSSYEQRIPIQPSLSP